MMKDHENRRIFHVVKFISIYVIVCFLHEPRWQIVVFQLETMVSLRYQCVPDLPAMGILRRMDFLEAWLGFGLINVLCCII